jgi:hypothetical protein
MWRVREPIMEPFLDVCVREPIMMWRVGEPIMDPLLDVVLFFYLLKEIASRDPYIDVACERAYHGPSP